MYDKLFISHFHLHPFLTLLNWRHSVWFQKCDQLKARNCDGRKAALTAVKMPYNRTSCQLRYKILQHVHITSTTVDLQSAPNSI